MENMNDIQHSFIWIVSKDISSTELRKLDLEFLEIYYYR